MAEYDVGVVATVGGVGIELRNVEAPALEDQHVLERAPEADLPRFVAGLHGGVHRAIGGWLRHEAAEVGIRLHARYGMRGEVILDGRRERTRRIGRGAHACRERRGGKKQFLHFGHLSFFTD